MGSTYEPFIPKLKHNEKLQKVDVETGEITDFPLRKKVANGMSKFDLMKTYHRRSSSAWDLLETQTSVKEYAVADKLARLATAYDSSLIPLSPESTTTEITEILNVDRRIVVKTIDKLFKLGVIGKFEVYDRFEIRHNYWVFNPYLSFNGSYIKKDVKTLFDNTHYAMVMKR